MNNVKDIMSIVKHNGKYCVYLPYIEIEKTRFSDKICKWWGEYDTFDECLKVALEKEKYYKHLEIDNKLLRKLKINKIWNQNK